MTKGKTYQGKPIDNELNVVLETYGLLDLGEKFLEAKVTSDVIWDLSQDELKEDVGLTRIELRRFMKAKQNLKATDSKEIVQQASAEAYGAFHNVTTCIILFKTMSFFFNYVHFVQ